MLGTRHLRFQGDRRWAMASAAVHRANGPVHRGASGRSQHPEYLGPNGDHGQEQGE
jgi:hypothetical protein